MLLVYFVIAAIPIGYIFGGRLRNYVHAPLKLVFLPCLAFLLEATMGWLAEHIPLPVDVWLGYAVTLEYLMLACFIVFNLKSHGIPLLGIGTVANFAAIAANGFRMPVSPLIHNFPGALNMASSIRSGNVLGYVLVGWDGPLWYLGDTIPLFRGLASIGDLLMAIAVFIIIISKMRAKPAAILTA